MKKLFILIIFLAGLKGTYSQDYTYYIPFNHQGIWGYSDTSGNMLIEPRFKMKPGLFMWDEVAKIRESIKGKILEGFIDAKGKEVVKPKYEHAELERFFICGLLNGTYYVMSRKGKLLLRNGIQNYKCSQHFILTGKKDSVFLHKLNPDGSSISRIRTFKGIAGFYFDGEHIALEYKSLKGSQPILRWYDTLGKFIREEFMSRSEWEKASQHYFKGPSNGGWMKENKEGRAPVKVCSNDTLYRRNLYEPKCYLVVRSGLHGMMGDSCNTLLPFEFNEISCFNSSYCFESYDSRELIFRARKGSSWGIITSAGKSSPFAYDTISMGDESYRYFTKVDSLYGMVHVMPGHIYIIQPLYKEIKVVGVIAREMVLYSVIMKDGREAYISDRGREYFD